MHARAYPRGSLPAMPILLYNLYSSDPTRVDKFPIAQWNTWTLEQLRVSFTLSAGSILVFIIVINVDTSAQVGGFVYSENS